MCEAEKDLVTENYNLIYKFIHDKNLYMKHGKDEVDDLIGLFEEKMCMMARAYDPTKNVAFSTYVYRGLTNAYTSYLQEKQRKYINIVDLASYQNENEDFSEREFWESIPDNKNNVEEYVEIKLRLEEFFSDILIWEREVVSLLADGYKQTEIEDILGLPRPYIWRVKRKLDAFLKQ